MIVKKNCNAPSKKKETANSGEIFYYVDDNVVFFATWEIIDDASCSYMDSGSVQCHIKCISFLPIINDKSTVVIPSLRKDGTPIDWDYYVDRSVYRELQCLQKEWEEKEEEEKEWEEELKKVKKIQNAFDRMEV